MKLHPLPALLAALAVAIPAISMAQDDRHEGRHDDRRASHSQHERADWDHPGYRHDEFRGAGPNHEWRRGGRLPAEYRDRQYVVDDWRGHHLSPPPRGYYWVQAGPDYVLVAIATGIIVDSLLLSQ